MALEQVFVDPRALKRFRQSRLALSRKVEKPQDTQMAG
jgi:hypothetical protein